MERGFPRSVLLPPAPPSIQRAEFIWTPELHASQALGQHRSEGRMYSRSSYWTRISPGPTKASQAPPWTRWAQSHVVTLPATLPRHALLPSAPPPPGVRPCAVGFPDHSLGPRWGHRPGRWEGPGDGWAGVSVASAFCRASAQAARRSDSARPHLCPQSHVCGQDHRPQ